MAVLPVCRPGDAHAHGGKLLPPQAAALQQLPRQSGHIVRNTRHGPGGVGGDAQLVEDPKGLVHQSGGNKGPSQINSNSIHLQNLPVFIFFRAHRYSKKLLISNGPKDMASLPS